MKLIDRVRAAAAELEKAGRAFTADDLADRLGIQDFAAKARLQGGQIFELVKKGELQREARGRYRWLGRQTGQLSKKAVMWRVLRARRLVSAADLAELAGVTLQYALEFLGRLTKQGVVQQISAPGAVNLLDKYRLVTDPVELPADDANIEKLRRWRERKRAALAALDAAWGAINEARLAVGGLEEG